MAAGERDPTDEDLLLSGRSSDFARFYDRHVEPLLAYFMRRTGDPEASADLTSETFAAAIVARARFRPGDTPAAAWLYTIAARRLADYRRRGYAEERARRRLGMQRRIPDADDAAFFRLLSDQATSDLLAELPDDQRTAVTARVLEDRSYPEIASALGVAEPAVRMRVSRGLARLRARMERT